MLGEAKRRKQLELPVRGEKKKAIRATERRMLVAEMVTEIISDAMRNGPASKVSK